MTISVPLMYDALAEHYRAYAAKRNNYIRAVDDFIVQTAPKSARRLIDIGCGDGFRGVELARRLHVSEVVLFDSSKEMIDRCRKLDVADVIQGVAEHLPHFDRKFDVALMLWNVLGHIETGVTRIQSLKRVAAAMNENAVFYLDVNNRQNGAAYGWWKMLWRVILDTLFFRESRGDVVYHWDVDGKSIPGKGHLFVYKELEQLLEAAGLQILDRVFIDYVTGASSKIRFKGQIVLKVGLKA